MVGTFRNHPLITKRSRSLRASATDAELRLWLHLRKRQLAGHKFRRQHPVDRYIVDFVCLEKRLIVEVDGGQHVARRNYDELRSIRLRRKGFRVIRFWDNDVLKNIGAVLETIWQALQAGSSPPPRPSP